MRKHRLRVLSFRETGIRDRMRTICWISSTSLEDHEMAEKKPAHRKTKNEYAPGTKAQTMYK